MSRSPMPRSVILAYISLCLIWGSTWMAIRVVVRDVPPFQAAGVRFLAAGVLLLGLAWAQRRRWPRGEQWKAVLVLSLTIMAVPYGLLFWAEQYVTSGMTAVLFSASPLLVALLTPLLMKRKVPRDAVFAMLVAFGGVAALLWTGLSSGGARALLGGLAVLAAVSTSSWSVVFAKQRLHDVDPVTGTGLQLLFGAAALLWATWAFEGHRHAVWSRPAVLATAFLTVFGSCAAFVIYYWLLKRMQPYQASTISLVVPIVAVLEGALLLREAVPFSMMLAITVVLGSVGAVLRPHGEPQSEDGKILMVQRRNE